MANFEIFQCSVCNRKTEKPVDQTHATISKCTITLKCTGNLIKIGQSDTKTMSGSQTVQNLTNWTPRTKVQAAHVVVAESVQIPINSAFDVLSIAVKDTLIGGVNSIDATFEIKKIGNASFIEYFYNRPSNTSLISGQDDSSKRLTLRFSNGANADSLIVYVNGVEVDPSTYDRTVEGRIVFNSILTDETNQVRVVVFKQAAPTYVTLTFNKNVISNANTTSSWGNISEVGIPKGTNYTVFTCFNVSTLLINSQLILHSMKPTSGSNFTGDFGYWLIGVAPYSTYDRDLLNAIPLSSMIASQEVVEYKVDVKNSPKFFIDSTLIQSMFPPIAIITKLIANVDINSVNDTNTQLANSYIT